MNIIGTLDDPILVNSAGDEQFAGCTGYPADSHGVIWLNVCRTKYRPTPFASGKPAIPHHSQSPSTLHPPSDLLPPTFPHELLADFLPHLPQMSRERPVERCPECGGVYRMEYIGPPDDPHDHHHHEHYSEPTTFAEFVRPEYRGTPQAHYKQS